MIFKKFGCQKLKTLIFYYIRVGGGDVKKNIKFSYQLGIQNALY